jgi:hypothetical protein
LYSQSAVREPRAEEWFEESARRFRRRYYGPWFVGLLAGLDRRLPRRGPAPLSAAAPPDRLRLPEDPSAYPLWVEVSPSPLGFPAAAERFSGPPEEPWSLPLEILERLPAAALTVRVTDVNGRERGAA